MTTQKGVTLEFSSKQKLFRQYVELLQPLLKLTSNEVAVFAQLLFLNNEKKQIPDKDRFQLIFSTTSRKEVATTLNLSNQVLQNCFSKLRKKNLIINNEIPKAHQVFIDDSLVLGFKLKLNV